MNYGNNFKDMFVSIPNYRKILLLIPLFKIVKKNIKRMWTFEKRY